MTRTWPEQAAAPQPGQAAPAALAAAPDAQNLATGHVRDTGSRESTGGLRSQWVAWSSLAGPGWR
jgi:hypothetical protein